MEDSNQAAAWLLRATQRPQLEEGTEAIPLGALEIVALTAEYRRLASGDHNWRVAQLAALIAKKLNLPDEEVELIRRAAPLHDIGTVFIPEKILLKPTKLLPEEFEVIKSHVMLGSRLLQGRSAVLETARTIVENHHERFDGSGYPRGKESVTIPRSAHIVALADVFDALIHEQPYRPAVPVADAVQQIRAQRGKKFDPEVVDALLRVLEEHYWLVRKRPEVEHEVLLEGHLGALSLFDVLGALAQNKKTGRLYVEVGQERGFMLVFEGQLLYAEYKKQYGETALLELFTDAELDDETTFRLEAWRGSMPPAEMHNIKTPTSQLLFDLAVKLDHEITRRNLEE